MTPDSRESPTELPGDARSRGRSDAQAVGSDAPERSASWRWKRRFVRVRRFVRRTFWSILLILVAVIGLISQTGRGQDIALRAAADRLRSSLAGQLTIDGIRSGSLLTGATLQGVRLDAADGRPFLRADSIVIRYSIPAVITGGAAIRSTTAWGVELEVSRYSEGDIVNVARLLAAGDSTPSTREPSRTRLGHLGIRGGDVRIVTPESDRDAPGVLLGPHGEPLRELRLSAVNVDVEDAVLTPGTSVEFAARLASFSGDIHILEDPLRVRQVFGSVTYGAQGIRIFDAAFRLPGTLLEGHVRIGPETEGDPWTFAADLDTDGWGDLGDLAWIDPRIPAGRFRGGAAIDVFEGVDITLREVGVELEASGVVLDGGARFADVMSLDGMRVSASPVTLERLEPWLEREIPLDGWLSGEALFSGTLADLDAEGRVTFVPTGFGGSPTTADFAGHLRKGAYGGSRGFRAHLEPFNYSVLDAFWPDIPWDGTGAAEVALDGDLEHGLRIETTWVHRTATGATSELDADGYLWHGVEEDDWTTDVAVELRPLAVDLLSRAAPDLALRGAVSGPARLRGPLDDLTVSGNLAAGSGRMEVEGRIDLGDPASGYRISLVADSLSLAELSGRIPERTRWSGRFTASGSGFSRDSADVAISLTAGRSRVGPVRVDTVEIGARINSGTWTTDSLRATIGGVDVTGRGSLGLSQGRWGSSVVDFSAPTLEGLRPLLMGVGDSILVSDGLSALDRELLRVQGIEPDTLPSRTDVRMDGAVTGSASISGGLSDLDLGAVLQVVGGTYRRNEVDSAHMAVSVTGLPRTDGAWEMGATGTGIVWKGRTFQRGGFEANALAGDGEGRLELVRRPGEEYRAVGRFAVDSSSVRIALSDLELRVDEDQWDLTHAGPIAWSSTALSVDSLEIRRRGADPMRLVVDGEVSRSGQSDFHLLVEGLHVERVLHMAQVEDRVAGGHIDADLTVRGTSRDPVIEGTFSVLGPRYGAVELTRLDGSLGYADRTATVEVRGWDAARPVLTGAGVMPLDLGFEEVDDRVPEAPMDLRFEADSLDAAIALSRLRSLEGVQGSVSGRVSVRGTPQAPEPDGTVRLEGGAWSIEAIGVRHRGVSGEVRVHPDRTVEVALSATGPGRSDVSGTVFLEPISNPVLDLDFRFDRFLAVSRADIEGYVSGGFDLTGNYRRPVASGALVVDEATIFVDELQRAADVVDLSDPFLFDADLAVDTTALVSQPLFAGFRNPFFDNLRVDVDLSVPRGSWLRSIDTNVEMTGDLLVRYDRSAGDFVLIGELVALRGSHRVLGRAFELDGGQIEFIGRPGMNPNLDIEASTRIRSPGEAPIQVNAEVTGTLVQPVVTLSSDEAGLAEEDLISYLIFGQPSGALGGGSAQTQGRIQDVNAVSSALQGGVTFLGGTLANQLGSAIARELTLDYVSIQQAGGARSLDGSLVGDAQVEFGRYVGDDVFVIMVLRPFDAGTQDQNNVAGLRVEVALTDDYNVEAFLEDRFLRSGGAGLRTSSSLIEDDRIWGVFLFREWGYGPSSDR